MPAFSKSFRVSGAVTLAKKFFRLLAASSDVPAPFLATCKAAPNSATASLPVTPMACIIGARFGIHFAMSFSSNWPCLPA